MSSEDKCANYFRIGGHTNSEQSSSVDDALQTWWSEAPAEPKGPSSESTHAIGSRHNYLFSAPLGNQVPVSHVEKAMITRFHTMGLDVYAHPARRTHSL
jgi:hypothetical protein